MTKYLLLVGGGHAHMATLASLRIFSGKGYKITVIGPSPYYYHSGTGPMLGRIYAPDDIRFSTQAMVKKTGRDFYSMKGRP